MAAKPKPKYNPPRGIRLSEATWKRLDKLRVAHGSYEKALRSLLAVNSKGKGGK